MPSLLRVAKEEDPRSGRTYNLERAVKLGVTLLDWLWARMLYYLQRRISTEPNFEEGLRRTVEWYLANQEWVEGVITGEYLEYYQRVYGTG